MFVSAGGASATEDTHFLTMNGTEYQSYKHSGDAIHWNTPTPDPSPPVAFFTERNQKWDGNGKEWLVGCETGLHWISNDNVLTISHCLDVEEPTTTVTTVKEEPTTTVTTVKEEPTTTAVIAPPSEGRLEFAGRSGRCRSGCCGLGGADAAAEHG